MKRNHWILALLAALLPLGLAPAKPASKPAPKTEEKVEKKVEQAPLVGGLKDLRTLNNQLVKLAERAAPATVSLMGGHGAGSGVVVSSDGLILSAAHVVSALGEEVTVRFPNGKVVKAEPLGADFDRDAAMLKITEPGEYPYVEIADADPLLVNQWCIALGHPGGFDPMRTPPLRLGRVLHSAQFLITDCAVVGGDSGGPLFDANGRVVGIHSNIGLTLSQNRHVPITVFRDQWDDMLEGKRHGRRFNTKAQKSPPQQEIDPDRAVLGVRLGEENDSTVKVHGVMKGSPAAKAGLKEGDVITKLNGKPTGSRDQFIETVGKMKPGKRIKLVYQRDGKMLNIRVKLARLGDLVKSDSDAKPQDKKDQAKDGKGGVDDLDAFLDKILENAKDGELRLELTPADVERFGGMAKIMERLKTRLAERKYGDKPDAKADKKDGEKDQPKPKPEAKKDKDQAAGKSSAAKLLERALKNQGKLELTPEDLDDLGGLDELMKELRDMAGSLDPEMLRKLMEGMGMGPAGPDDFYLSSMKALEPVAKKTAGSTVEVLVDDKPVAFGTAVSEDGWILTKDTETREGTVTVRAGDIIVDTALVRRFPERDLALFQLDTGDVRPVSLKKSPDGPPLGSLLTVTDADDKPAGIGVVSVKTRALGQVGFLGVAAGETEGGLLANQVIKEGPAAKAGLKQGDIITKVDDKLVSDPFVFAQTIRSHKVGETVRLGLLRDGKKQSIEVKLGKRPTRKMPDRFKKMNQMSGPLSEKTAGFPQALQHDIPIPPSQCGGPLLDLDGRCVGINVSRAGRVKTLAIPAAEVAELLAGVRQEMAAKDAKKDQPAPGISDEEIDEISKTLQEIQSTLKALEQRLNKAESR